jgi:hypothetical protein
MSRLARKLIYIYFYLFFLNIVIIYEWEIVFLYKIHAVADIESCYGFFNLIILNKYIVNSKGKKIYFLNLISLFEHFKLRKILD